MKDAALAVHLAYYTRLSVSGLWPVYDRPKGTDKPPYNLIEEVLTSDGSSKTHRGQIVTVQISCNAAYTGDSGGKKEVEDQGTLILEAIDTRSNRIDCASDFHVVTTILESAATIEDQRTEPTNIIRRVLRFRHEVDELTPSP